MGGKKFTTLNIKTHANRAPHHLRRLRPYHDKKISADRAPHHLRRLRPYHDKINADRAPHHWRRLRLYHDRNPAMLGADLVCIGSIWRLFGLWQTLGA